MIESIQIDDLAPVRTLRAAGWTIGARAERTDMWTVSARRGALTLATSATTLIGAVDDLYREVLARSLSRGGRA